MSTGMQPWNNQDPKREIPEWHARAQERRMARLRHEALREPRALDMPGYDGSGPSYALMLVVARANNPSITTYGKHFAKMYDEQKQREVAR